MIEVEAMSINISECSGNEDVVRVDSVMIKKMRHNDNHDDDVEGTITSRKTIKSGIIA